VVYNILVRLTAK